MKLLLLGNHASPHIIKWSTALAERGYRILIFSLTEREAYSFPEYCFYDAGTDDDSAESVSVKSEKGGGSIELVSAGIPLSSIRNRKSRLGKLRYFRTISLLKKTIRSFEPDIVHAHRATSYGLLGVLAGANSLTNGLITSVWGEDVYSFPRRSPVHSALLRFVLARSAVVLSTSNVMAGQTQRFTDKEITVTPFGIDLETFRPLDLTGSITEEESTTKSEAEKIIVGTVKTLEERYGIEYLLRAFARAAERMPDLPLELLVVGGGSQYEQLLRLSKELGIEEKTTFTGRVPFEQVPAYHNKLTVAVYASITDSESFGVSVIESSACEKPVVVSNVGGLPEVVADGETGIIVPAKDVEALAGAIEELVSNPELRERMGRAGRRRVERYYDWSRNVDLMESIYSSVLAGRGGLTVSTETGSTEFEGSGTNE